MSAVRRGDSAALLEALHLFEAPDVSRVLKSVGLLRSVSRSVTADGTRQDAFFWDERGAVQNLATFPGDGQSEACGATPGRADHNVAASAPSAISGWREPSARDPHALREWTVEPACLPRTAGVTACDRTMTSW